jgi:hypothetical protein
MTKSMIFLSLVAASLSTYPDLHAQVPGRLDGQWKLDPAKSASIDPWGQLSLEIRIDGSRVTLVKRYSAGNALDRRVDSMTVSTEVGEEHLPVPPGRWLGQVSMGVYYGPGTVRRVQARLNESRNELQIRALETVQTAQGSCETDVKETFTVSPDGGTLQWSEARSTRKSGPPLTYTFARIAQ